MDPCDGSVRAISVTRLSLAGPTAASAGKRAKENGSAPCGTDPLILFLLLARLAGFEPTTPWFVAKYSIQLSYSR